MDPENRKEYQKMADSNRLVIRMNAYRKTLLQTMMKKEGWTNKSGFVAYKIFGDETEQINRLIQQKDPENIAILLLNQMLELAEFYTYVKYGYNKDMNQLYKEEGVNVDEWRKKTNKWHSELVKKTEETFRLVRMIAKVLGIDDYFKMPSDEMHFDYEHMSKEEMDAIAEQVRKEHIALGLGDIVDN